MLPEARGCLLTQRRHLAPCRKRYTIPARQRYKIFYSTQIFFHTERGLGVWPAADFEMRPTADERGSACGRWMGWPAARNLGKFILKI